jgi:hypothetical protein
VRGHWLSEAAVNARRTLSDGVHNRESRSSARDASEFSPWRPHTEETCRSHLTRMPRSARTRVGLVRLRAGRSGHRGTAQRGVLSLNEHQGGVI